VNKVISHYEGQVCLLLVLFSFLDDDVFQSDRNVREKKMNMWKKKVCECVMFRKFSTVKQKKELQK